MDSLHCRPPIFPDFFCIQSPMASGSRQIPGTRSIYLPGTKEEIACMEERRYSSNPDYGHKAHGNTSSVDMIGRPADSIAMLFQRTHGFPARPCKARRCRQRTRAFSALGKGLRQCWMGRHRSIQSLLESGSIGLNISFKGRRPYCRNPRQKVCLENGTLSPTTTNERGETPSNCAPGKFWRSQELRR